MSTGAEVETRVSPEPDVWEAVGGQASAVSLLRRDVASGRVAHAYLFAGAAGTVPVDLALAFAAALICADAGCGECGACRRVRHHAHPDVEIIVPSGMQLLVEQVREAVLSSSRRPVAGPRRVIVVEGADRMNLNAQNAFLKALEEPPASTTIVLIAPSVEALEDTVRSRCREIAFRTPPRAEIVALLEREGVPPDDASRWARVGGVLERARALALDEHAAAVRQAVVERVLEPPRDPGDALSAAEWLAGEAKNVRERVATQQAEQRAEHEDWYREAKRTAEDRSRREQRRAEQDQLEAALDDIACVLRDLLAAAHASDADLLDEASAPRTRALAAELGPRCASGLIACLGDVERARRRLRANANVLLALEDVFLSIHRHLSRARGSIDRPPE